MYRLDRLMVVSAHRFFPHLHSVAGATPRAVTNLQLPAEPRPEQTR